MKKSVLQKNQTIGSYSVMFFLKKGRYAETYRVKNSQGKTKIIKLFIYSKLHRTQFDDNDNILEIELLKNIKHPNIVSYCDSGDIVIESQRYAYAVFNFISGETLADKMKREHTINKYEAKNIILGILNAVNYLHSLKHPIIHNEITNLNVMLDLSGKVAIPKLIDFGYARWLSQSNKSFLKDGLNSFYLANESFNKVFSIQSDIFQIGALYYHLLEGLPPWFVDISPYKTNRIDIEDTILQLRQKPLSFDEITDKNTQHIIEKALQPNTENRFVSVKDFIKAVNGELELQLSTPLNTVKKPQKQVKKGKGFSAIAGMQELKNTMKLDVIDALNDKERYAEYGLTIPNGLLLYGPPGCGKTFFAEKMAEEIGFNFYHIIPSDIQSKWVNASQENIKNLFDKARENAPSIIFIDELDALMPNRDTPNISHMNTTAVNEFLTQMNNCGDDGIFVIGATNRKQSIDPAILRAGRLDKQIYVPPPDFEARKSMFELYLKYRPIELGLDYEILAEETENYVSSDIKFLCDESSRNALKNNTKITQNIILDVIKNREPSIAIDELQKYDDTNKPQDSDSKIKIGFI